jgi:hypothetical protein
MAASSNAPVDKQITPTKRASGEPTPIGEGGLKLAKRDMNRCRNVLVALGQDVPEAEA